MITTWVGMMLPAPKSSVMAFMPSMLSESPMLPMKSKLVSAVTIDVGGGDGHQYGGHQDQTLACFTEKVAARWK